MFLRLSVAVGLMAISAAASSTQAQPWEAYVDPAQAGFNPAKLEEARAFADANNAAAVMVVHRGHVVAAWGAVDRPLMVHSVRKSLAGALYGIASHDRLWSLGTTLSELGFDDQPPLTADEKRARIIDLIASRSGVYHDAAYASVDQARERPARGSHSAGTFWFYNNWDFNAAEAIYQQTTRQDLYASFENRIARAIGMEDFDPAVQLRVLEPSHSRFPAHTFRMSARDLARFGQLYLQEGEWNGRAIVPGAWIKESLKVHSPTKDKEGYGYLWWVYEAGPGGPNYPALNGGPVYLARGTGGQAVFLIPSREMVVVHLSDSDNGRPVKGPAIWQLAERLAAAKERPATAQPILGPMRATKLASNLPAPAPPTIVPLDDAVLARIVGDYAMPRGETIRTFVHDRRLFMSVPGLGEAELFATGPLSFTVKVQPGVAVTFQAMPDGKVAGVLVLAGGQRIEAAKR
jgi:CubicO group peptidase (beta-lactamase class C family)